MPLSLLGCRHTEKPQAQQTRPTCSCCPDPQVGSSEVSGGGRDGGGMKECPVHSPCTLLSQLSLSCVQPLADTGAQGYLETPALPSPWCLHSALVLEWKYTPGQGKAMATPKRNFSKTGETQDLRSSIVIYDKRWGW